MNSKFIPLSVPSFQGNELKYVSECIETEWVSTAGKYVNEFEKRIAEFTGAEFAVACSNGTAALHISLILSGVSSNDEVIVPTLTFISPVNTVRYCGAFPVFMDCDEYLNIDVNKVAEFCEKECDFRDGFLVNKVSGRKVKAVIPVHIFGNPVNIEPLVETAGKYNLKVVEDATESLGSYYIKGKYSGKKTGTVGDFGCLSFNGNKIITTGGGGMILTSDQNSAEKAKYLTTQAKDDELYYVHNEVGYNYRMTNLQAAVGVAQLEKIEEYIKIKRENFIKYNEKIEQIKGLSLIGEPEYAFSNFWMYSLIVDEEKYSINRDELLRKFSDRKIQTRPVWKLNHEQFPYVRERKYDIRTALYLYPRILNIPCSVNLDERDIETVLEILNE